MSGFAHPLGSPAPGELLTAANYGLKCAFCADPAIRDGLPLDDVPDAVTFAGQMQTFTISTPQGVQEIMAPLALPVCYGCRGKQLAPMSKTGLVTA